MSKLGINTGSTPNDGQGDSLRVAMGKINHNFTEIYDTLGDGNNVISYASTAGIATVAENLTGNPIVRVGGLLNSGITTTEHIEVRNITATGVITATQFFGDGSQLQNVAASAAGLDILDNNVRKGIAKEINFGANLHVTPPDGVGRVTVYMDNSFSSASDDGTPGGSGGSDVPSSSSTGLSFEVVNDTTVKIQVIGSDGITRSANITLS